MTMKAVSVALLFALFVYSAWTKQLPTINTPEGLQAGDIIQWKGIISSRRQAAVLHISSGDKLYSVMKMKIQGFRHQLAFSYGIRGNETMARHGLGKEEICRVGKSVVAPRKNFDVIIRVFRSDIAVYFNGKLTFTLPLVDPRQEISTVREIKVYESTNVLKILSDRDFEQEMFDSECGKSSTKKTKVPLFCPSTNTKCRVVNGGPALPGSQPWQAAIRRKRSESGQNSHICGATLISNCWAVTAGHCYDRIRNSNLNEFVLRVGDYYNRDSSMFSKDKTVEQSADLEIEKIIRHPSYQPSPAFTNDIALIKLKKCAVYSDFVKPACLPKTKDQFLDGSAMKCGISGWGATDQSQTARNYPACLQAATVRVRSQTTCRNAYPGLFNNITMLCASGVGCADTCHGDSGGPLVCSSGPKSRYTLWGITSWGGANCGDRHRPGVYTRLSTYMKWLFVKTKLSPDSDTYYNLLRTNRLSRNFCQHEIRGAQTN